MVLDEEARLAYVYVYIQSCVVCIRAYELRDERDGGRILEAGGNGGATTAIRLARPVDSRSFLKRQSKMRTQSRRQAGRVHGHGECGLTSLIKKTVNASTWRNRFSH